MGSRKQKVKPKLWIGVEANGGLWPFECNTHDSEEAARHFVRTSDALWPISWTDDGDETADVEYVEVAVLPGGFALTDAKRFRVYTQVEYLSPKALKPKRRAFVTGVQVRRFTAVAVK